MNRSVILLSGGLDSTTCLALAKSRQEECYTLSFNYGQRHCTELNRAQQIAQSFEVNQHEVFRLPVEIFAGSALTDANIAVPEYTGSKAIPVTYVPARNTIFLAIALGWAESIGANRIYIGVSAVDYSGYPDCRPEYITAFQKMADLATQCGVANQGVKIETPLIKLSKAETIKLGLSLGVNYHLTVSCYNLDTHGNACGKCDSCSLRRKGFEECGVTDQTQYGSNATVL
ncbi:MAG: 7-cyano-7-deazaguanine synthase QueC [Proteobacteria bacterium]|nr:7-cyano-7-deazaguanine synthase QueC [Pseudomonadota bacterium]